MRNPNERVFVIRGGQGASKTISILELIIQALLSSTKEATVLSSELSKMKKTVIRDYKKITRDWGILTGEEFNRSESKHEYPNDSYIDFLGADVNDVGKGFRRDILYINEADRMNIDAAVQFISRAKLTIIDYNPDSLFWGDDYINDNNFITLTYQDNEYLSQAEVESILDYKTKGFHNSSLPYKELFEPDNIKSTYWANKWKVYGLGEVGSLQGVVFDNWSQVESIPKDATLVCYGMDFGYSNDPTALVACYKLDGKYYFDELLYRTGLTNPDIGNFMKSASVSGQVICDSAEPKSIAEIRNMGFKCEPARKGPDSIRISIDALRRDQFFVTQRSTNLIKELRGYSWKTSKDGKTLDEPNDYLNHAIDAVRYIALNKLTNINRGVYAFR